MTRQSCRRACTASSCRLHQCTYRELSTRRTYACELPQQVLIHLRVEPASQVRLHCRPGIPEACACRFGSRARATFPKYIGFPLTAGACRFGHLPRWQRIAIHAWQRRRLRFIRNTMVPCFTVFYYVPTCCLVCNAIAVNSHVRQQSSVPRFSGKCFGSHWRCIQVHLHDARLLTSHVLRTSSASHELSSSASHELWLGGALVATLRLLR